MPHPGTPHIIRKNMNMQWRGRGQCTLAPPPPPPLPPPLPLLPSPIPLLPPRSLLPPPPLPQLPMFAQPNLGRWWPLHAVVHAVPTAKQGTSTPAYTSSYTCRHLRHQGAPEDPDPHQWQHRHLTPPFPCPPSSPWLSRLSAPTPGRCPLFAWRTCYLRSDTGSPPAIRPLRYLHCCYRFHHHHCFHPHRQLLCHCCRNHHHFKFCCHHNCRHRHSRPSTWLLLHHRRSMVGATSYRVTPTLRPLHLSDMRAQDPGNDSSRWLASLPLPWSLDVSSPPSSPIHTPLPHTN